MAFEKTRDAMDAREEVGLEAPREEVGLEAPREEVGLEAPREEVGLEAPRDSRADADGGPAGPLGGFSSSSDDDRAGVFDREEDSAAVEDVGGASARVRGDRVPDF